MMIAAITGFSTSGKTFIAHSLPELEFAQLVSITTRPKRKGEFEGLDYYYVSESDFDTAITSGELLEWTEYCGYRYGLKFEEIKRAIRNGLIPCHVCTPSGLIAIETYAESINESIITAFIEANAETIIFRMIKRWQVMPKLSLVYLSQRIATSLCVETLWGGRYNFIAETSEVLVQSIQDILDCATGKAPTPQSIERKPTFQLDNFDRSYSNILTVLRSSTHPKNANQSKELTDTLINILFRDS
jgi:hypothetical protein